MENFDALKHYESTADDRRTWLRVPSGILWSSSSDTHQRKKNVRKIFIEMSMGDHLVTGSEHATFKFARVLVKIVI